MALRISENTAVAPYESSSHPHAPLYIIDHPEESSFSGYAARDEPPFYHQLSSSPPRYSGTRSTLEPRYSNARTRSYSSAREPCYADTVDSDYQPHFHCQSSAFSNAHPAASHRRSFEYYDLVDDDCQSDRSSQRSLSTLYVGPTSNGRRGPASRSRSPQPIRRRVSSFASSIAPSFVSRSWRAERLALNSRTSLSSTWGDVETDPEKSMYELNHAVTEHEAASPEVLNEKLALASVEDTEPVKKGKEKNGRVKGFFRSLRRHLICM